MKYTESKISKNVLRGVEEMGFVEMTPIQEITIPPLMEGKDIIGQAQTGTGKTAAFGIPMIERINPNIKGVQGLVLCPTRELAMQVAEELHKLARYTQGIKIVPVYGGQDMERQIRALKGNVSIVVGTPGRVMDHMRRRTLKFKQLSMLVLDEADEMLNMGFREDIETICQDMPEGKQMALFSATMPDEILQIAGTYQKNAVLLKVKQKELTIPLIKQYFYVVKNREKTDSLIKLIDYMSPHKALIFCNTKRMVDELTLLLKGRGYSAEALHGDLSQHQRDRVMGLFRSGGLDLLIATDVAARGLDVEDVDMVFNYDMPQDMEYYVHRIGRTGRAGKKGKAFSVITSREIYKIKSLRDYCKTDIEEKQLPSAGKVNMAKAEKTLSDAIEFCRDKDLEPYMELVFKKGYDSGLDALQIAAAFLRMNMGELFDETNDRGREWERRKPQRGRRDDKRDGRRDDKRDGRRETKREGKRDVDKGGQRNGGAEKRKDGRKKPKKNNY